MARGLEWVALPMNALLVDLKSDFPARASSKTGMKEYKSRGSPDTGETKRLARCSSPA